MKLILRFLTVLAAVLTLGTMACAQAQPAPSGNWTGALTVSGTTLHLVVHFLLKPNGTLTATFDSIDQVQWGCRSARRL